MDGGDIIFNCKLNAKIIKILLALIIISFFTPFFSVSCNSNDPGVNFSGFELSSGKTAGNHRQNGNPLGFILIVPAAALLALSFFCESPKNKLCAVYKTALFFAPLFDIPAVFIIKHYFTAEASKILDSMKMGGIRVIIGVKPGFALYVLLNTALFVFAAANCFIKRK